MYENLTFTSPELTSLPILVSFQGTITKVLRNSKLTQFRCVDRKKIQTILFLDALHTYSPETPPCPKQECSFPPANPVFLVWEWRVTSWTGQSSRSFGICRASTETCRQSISYMILKCNIWLVKCGTNLVPRYVVWEIKQLELPASLGDTTQSRVIGLRNSAEHGSWQCLSLRSTTTQHWLYLYLMNGPDFVPASPWICCFSALINLYLRFSTRRQ